jgi:beta-lactamase superfamily II metal-dependent hydrolase
MSNGINPGDEVYAGYPHAFVYNFYRNTKKKLVFGKVKHLLWGDWTVVSDYDYAQDPAADIRNDAELQDVQTKPAGMVPVRVRGVSGYMHKEDLQSDRLLEIVFVDVGQGDGALLVTPGDRKYVVDAGVGDNMYRYLKWRFADFSTAHTDFDGLIITHPDKDHYYGFTSLVSDPQVQAANIWHNGLVEQFGVSASGAQLTSKDKLLGNVDKTGKQSFLTGLIETDSQLGAHLANRDRWVKKSSGKAKQYPELLNDACTARTDDDGRRFPNIAMLSTAHGEIHDGRSYLPGHGPDNSTGCIIEIIGPVVEPDSQGVRRLRTFAEKPSKATKQLNTGKTKNGHSVLLRLCYKQASILFGGDLNSPAEMFLLQHYTGLPVYDAGVVPNEEIVEAGRPVLGADITKACHHGSADFTDVFLSCINPAATVISSGDEESHAHPRCDALGAIGHHGRGHRSLIFSTELSRSTAEFTNREDSPWYKAFQLKEKALNETDPAKKSKLEEEANDLLEERKKHNVTVYGSINLRSDGEKVVLAYMLEKPSRARRWDIYTLEPTSGGPLRYRPLKEAQEAEKKRRKQGNNP